MLRSTTVAPFVVVKLLSKEVGMVLSQNLRTMQRQDMQRIGRTIIGFATEFIDKFYKDLSELNPDFSPNKMIEKDVKNLLLSVSDVQTIDFFVYKEQYDSKDFIIQAIQRLVQLAVNFGFLSAQETDKIVATVSGYCSPCGGFSSRLVLQYLIMMQQYWS